MSLVEILQDQNPWWREPGARRALRYPVRRDLHTLVLSRLLREGERRAMVILGPRQVGKTVLLWQLADDLIGAGLPPANVTYFDFSDDRLTTPVAAREIAQAVPVGADPEQPRVLLLDEIRLAPQWDRWLKQAVDAGGLRIVATDSAASLLRDGGRESGQGRWDELHLEGLSLTEFLRLQAGADEDAEEVLRRLPNLPERYLALGGFPEHAASEDYPDVRRRLRTDIADRAILRDLAGFDVDVQRVKDLFVYLLQDSGVSFDATARARDLGADPRSVREWVRLLEQTLLLLPLERFTRQPSSGLRSRPRLYAADHGLVAAFATLPPSAERVRARIFEAAVFRHLREVVRATGGELSYFRQDDDLEVDFVADGPAGVTAVEVTSASRLRREKVERLRKAGQALGTGRLVLIHGGLVDEEAEGVRPIPLTRALLHPESLLARGDA